MVHYAAMEKKDIKTRRQVKDKRVLQTGVRRRFFDALDPIRSEFPRKNLVNHSGDWYTDGHLVGGRPLFSILSLSNYAEYLLYHARLGRRGQSRGFNAAMAFFAATRRAMFYVLHNYPSFRTLTTREASLLRTRLTRLVELARVAREAVRNKETHSVYKKGETCTEQKVR